MFWVLLRYGALDRKQECYCRHAYPQLRLPQCLLRIIDRGSEDFQNVLESSRML